MSDKLDSIATTLSEKLRTALPENSPSIENIELIPLPTDGDPVVQIKTVEDLIKGESRQSQIRYLLQITPARPQTAAARTWRSSLNNQSRMASAELCRTAQTLLQSGSFDEARKVYQALLDTGDMPALAHEGIANCEIGMSRWELARRHLDHALTFEPSLDRYLKLATCHEQLGNPGKAFDILQRPTRISSILETLDDSSLRALELRRAQLALLNGSLDPVIAIARGPQATEAAVIQLRFQLAERLSKDGRLDEALATYAGLLKDLPDSAKAAKGMADTELARGMKREAHDRYALCLSLDIEQPLELAKLIKLSLELRIYSSAARLTRAYIDRHAADAIGAQSTHGTVTTDVTTPNIIPLMYSLAGLEFHLARYEQCKDMCLRILDRNPEHVGAKSLLERTGNHGLLQGASDARSDRTDSLSRRTDATRRDVATGGDS